MKKITGKFWITNRFIRLHAKNLSIYEQMVYITICCYAGGKPPITFVGCRKIAEVLSISKNTVNSAEKKLEKYGLIERPRNKNGKVSHIKILTVPFGIKQMSQPIGHKELNIKEDIKEGKKEKIEHIGSIIAKHLNYL